MWDSDGGGDEDKIGTSQSRKRQGLRAGGPIQAGATRDCW